MNTIDYSQTGGFPFDQSTLDFIQSQVLLLQQMAALCGPLAIVSGCAVTGSNAANGIVVINGEVLPFVGGAVAPKVIAVETDLPVNYHDGSVKLAKKTRYATFGDDGVQNNVWANFKRNTTEGLLARVDRLERIAAPFFPTYDGNGNLLKNGGMVLWKMPAYLIPAGWAEVVDWRGRLPMGYDPNDPNFDGVGNGSVNGTTGGSKTFTLTINNIPAHKHFAFSNVTAAPGYSQANANGPAAVSGDAGGNPVAYQMAQGDGTATVGPTSSVGGNQTGGTDAVNILNPFRIVMFIEYVGV